MAYIGKTPSQATRSRFYYTATGGETSLSGADDNSNTLVFSDGNYVDVMLNGVNLVAGTDYNTTTANTIGGLTALTASDIVEIVVYDTFSVFGGDVKGDFNVQNGTLTAETVTASGLVTAQDGLVVDNDGATVATFDRATSDGTIVDLQKDGATVGSIDSVAGLYTSYKSNGSNLYLGVNDSLDISLDSTRLRPTSDATISLGSGSNRFTDLVLSGGVYLGGTGSANKLDDYEEGTWTVNLLGNSTAAVATGSTGHYTKIGEMVYASFAISLNTNSDTNNFRISGLPFAIGSSENDRGGIAQGWQNSGNDYISNGPQNTSRFDIYDNSGNSYSFSNWSNKSLKATFIYRVN